MPNQYDSWHDFILFLVSTICVFPLLLFSYHSSILTLQPMLFSAFPGPTHSTRFFSLSRKSFLIFSSFFRRVGFFFHVFFLHSLSHCCCSKTTTSERERRDELNVGVRVDGLVFWPISREGWKMSLYLYNVESSNISKGWFFLLFSIFSLWAREQRVS